MPEGNLQNNYKYQGTFSEMDADIGWNDFELRNYDAQVGRWVQQDPLQQFASPYLGEGNDPINNIDQNGGWAATGLFEGLSQVGITAVTTLAGALIGEGVDLLSGGSGGKGLLIGAGLGLATNLGGDFLEALAKPSIKLISGGFKQDYLGANLDATFKVKHVKASGLQIIQTLNGPDELPNLKTLSPPHHYGKFSKVENGVRIGGFVDGGINSLQAKKYGPVNKDMPYYLNESPPPPNTPSRLIMLYKDFVNWGGDMGTIRVKDIPQLLVGEANFETIIVAKNYRGTKKDKILGHFRWGTVDLVGTKNIDFEKYKGGIDLKGDGKISEISKEIINFDYPNYKF
ncbi:MAG TPA: RHS repeat-associated core domain-containing protein [Hanamia sp.]|nr:RHS repeat-associated core domain-containing protein [Hanamia sp.]